MIGNAREKWRSEREIRLDPQIPNSRRPSRKKGEEREESSRNPTIDKIELPPKVDIPTPPFWVEEFYKKPV